MYNVLVSKRVRKEMRRIPPKDQEHILAALDSLAENPRPVGYGHVEDAPNTYRIHVGRYRVV
jgi:mRNA-degrading endonuclease RelE of RelBE toxin-antitoxin system